MVKRILNFYKIYFKPKKKKKGKVFHFKKKKKKKNGNKIFCYRVWSYD